VEGDGEGYRNGKPRRSEDVQGWGLGGGRAIHRLLGNSI